MKVYESEADRSTYVCPEDTLFYKERRAVVPSAETTSVMVESYELKEIPPAIILEHEFEIVTDLQSLRVLALKSIQEVAGGKLTEWSEEEHLGEKSLFETFQKEQ